MMAEVKELLERRANIWEKAKELIDRVEAEGRDFNTEEQSQYDKMMDEMDELAKRAKRLEEKQRFEAQMSMPINEPVRAIPTDQKEDRGKDLMPEFRAFIKTGVISPELRALQVDPATQGGNLLPPQQFVAELIKEIDDAVFIRRLATVIPVNTSDSLGAPTLDTDLDDADWTTEVQSITEGTMTFGKRELKPNQLSKLVKVSMKLLRTSAIPVESLVSQRLAYKFAITEEKAFLLGSGTGEPLGLFTVSTDGISAARDVPSTGGKITADSLIDAKYALKAQYRNGAQWIFHRDVIKLIAKLKDNDDQYLWRPGISLGQPDTLLNLPVNESEYAPNTVTVDNYVGIIGNFRYYWIAELMGMELQRLNELFAQTSQVGFIGRMWVDGAPVLESAFARIKIAA
ncbi:MAG: phage major capsid protein [Sphaerochaeta sp.]